MSISKEKLKQVIVLICTIILGLLIIALLKNKLTFFDKQIYHFVIQFKSSFLTSFFKVITFFASFSWFFLLIIGLFLVFKRKKLTMFLIAYLLIISLITLFLKGIFLRNRPIDLMLIKEYGYSFPSGHSSISMAFYGLVSYLVYKSSIKRKYKILFIPLLLIFSLLIGISRIYLGVHYPSDVLAGFMIGIIYLMIFIKIFNIKKKGETK